MASTPFAEPVVTNQLVERTRSGSPSSLEKAALYDRPDKSEIDPLLVPATHSFIVEKQPTDVRSHIYSMICLVGFLACPAIPRTITLFRTAIYFDVSRTLTIIRPTYSGRLPPTGNNSPRSEPP